MLPGKLLQIYSTQLKFIRNTVAGRLKDTHENNGDKQTNKKAGLSQR